MEIVTRYKIQAALKQNYSSNVESSHFWRLIKERTLQNGETFSEVEDICEKDLYGTQGTTAINNSPLNLKTSTVKPGHTHIVYGDRVNEMDAKARWDKAIKKINQFLAIVTLQQRPDLFYSFFSHMLEIEAYCFLEKAFSSKHAPVYNMSSPAIQYPLSRSIRYKIKAAMRCVVLEYDAFTLRLFPISNLRAGHYFWMLVAQEQGEEYIIETLHGLATRCENPEKPERVVLSTNMLRSWGAYLKVYCITPPIQDANVKETSFEKQKVLGKDWISPTQTKVVYGDLPNHDALALWQHAHIIMQDLNQSGPFPYSFLGLGKTFGIQATNSNSIYATLALRLNLTPHQFKGYLAPGINRPILSVAKIENQRSALK